ncbi:site-specific DNA-methyltransferase [Elioraea sp. Yellowstone]|uniref:site-specific DNA-methyltransferase n=2 Tax=Acetobacterales TaxID=3120395 RepID=UPI001153673A|nr:site-specific DNA-methyltransferase [Elioraea sp. Yellowstone]TQF78655.1 site-specific DNA-methyltransferase [Elioraea sp. Yellowstone]
MPPAKKTTGNGASAATTEVETLRHPADVTRRNIPTAETSSLMAEEEARARLMLYPRNPDLDPQLVWRGKDAQDAEALAVPTVPIYIQEKVLPEALIRDLQRQSRKGTAPQADLFGGFDRIEDPETRLEFYAHAENWSNRMILGDSLLVMNSLAEKEGLRGQVQMIYLDPPYGIRFASNWQPSTKEPKAEDRSEKGLSREPEQIKAFRDTWKDGIHSYLAYLRDRLIVARELLTDSGSIFIQIGIENSPLIRLLLAEVFGYENHICDILIQKTGSQTGEFIQANSDVIVWYARNRTAAASKFRKLFLPRDGKPEIAGKGLNSIDRDDWSAYPLTSDGFRETTTVDFEFEGQVFHPGANRHWGVTTPELARAARAGRIVRQDRMIRMKFFWDDYPVRLLGHVWNDVGGARDKVYVVQTAEQVVQRCILMTTDPGDLVLDPTCGSGTTAFVAEQFGRRWITIDTSRVALALARTRLMAARHPAYLLRDSREGAAKEAEITGRPPEEGPFHGDIRQGFVLERVPHVTLKSIASNAEIDVIHEKWQPKLDAARAALNAVLGTAHEEWQVPRSLPEDAPAPAREAHAAFWQARRERQAEMDASIARNAEVEFLHDRPYPKKGAVRVTGPFTVESLSPHRVLPADEEDEAVVEALAAEAGEAPPPRRRLRPNSEATASTGDDFVTAVLDNLAKAGVQNTKKNERLTFATIRPWPGKGHVAAEATYEEAGQQRRAAIVIGPEYGTVGQELVREAARECRDWADALVVCGFAFDPQVGETTMNLGRLTVLKARMSQELHAADAYKAGGGNLFVVFGEPDIALDRTKDGACIVRLRGVDIFDPTTGEVRSSGKVEEDVACWFVDTDYDGDSFFVRQAYFLGGKDPFEKLKTALKAEVDEAAWSTLYAKESRPFPAPKSGRIAVKVINHYGDEAMRVFKVG